MKYLAIDYGKKKVGLAISEGELATPYKILDVTSLEEAVEQVSRVIQEEGIEKVLIGQPESGVMVNLVKNFVKKMAGRGVGVVRVPETLSTYQARSQMRIIGSSKKNLSREDSFSASIILQDYLDSNVDNSE